MTPCSCGISDADITEHKAVAAEHWRLVEENRELRAQLAEFRARLSSLQPPTPSEP